MDRKVYNRIRRYKRDFDISTQKAELLGRNRKFLDDLETILNRTLFDHVKPDEFDGSIKELRETHTKRYYLKVRKELFGKLKKRKSKIVEKILDKNSIEEIGSKDITAMFHRYIDDNEKEESRKGLKVHFQMLILDWERFCREWNIHHEWDGDLTSLTDYLKPPVELLYVKGEDDLSPEILLRITEWTTLDDMKDMWGIVEKYQKQMGKKWEKRGNFTRDLCWYDLAKEQGLKLREIAKHWIEKFPDEIDILVARRIKKKIHKEDFKGKAPEDTELINEIISGYLKEKYKSHFDDERTFYTTGKTGNGTLNPPLIDAIRKSIKRMDDLISLFDSYPVKSREIDRILSFGLSIRLK
jgi:hypothetical protein